MFRCIRYTTYQNFITQVALRCGACTNYFNKLFDALVLITGNDSWIKGGFEFPKSFDLYDLSF